MLDNAGGCTGYTDGAQTTLLISFKPLSGRHLPASPCHGPCIIGDRVPLVVQESIHRSEATLRCSVETGRGRSIDYVMERGAFFICLGPQRRGRTSETRVRYLVL